MEARIEQLMLQLAQSQLTSNAHWLADAQKANATNEVLDSCDEMIITFKKENVTNFLASVGACCRKFNGDAEKIAKVLEYAKLRVEHNVLVEVTTFETFEQFETMLTARYLQTKTHTHLMLQLLMSRQGNAEKTKDYANKFEAVKEEHLRALKSYYARKGFEFSVSRIDEAEMTATWAFITGLRDDVRKYIQSMPKKFSEAVSMALDGEQANELRKKANRNSAATEPAERKRFVSRAYMGNSRQHSQPRGGYRGYNRGYQGANSYYNRATGQSTANTGNQQQDNKSIAIQRNGGGPDVAGFSNNYNTPRGNGRPQINRGCFVCGDRRHKAVDCTQQACVTAVGQPYKAVRE